MNKQNAILQGVYLKSPWFIKNLQASAYSFLVSRNKYGSVFKYWSQLLKESQYWDNKRLRRFQSEILKDFLLHVKNNSPFYSGILSRNPFTSRQNLDQYIKSLPFLKKEDVRRNNIDILGHNINRKLYNFYSSGTTGTALHVYLDNEAYEREYAFRWHYLNIGGANRKSRFAYFIGNKLFPIDRNSPPFHIIDHYERGIFFSIFHMSEKSLPSYVKAFNNYKPEYIKGYPSGLYTFANYVHTNGLTIHKPKAIYSASEVLRDYQKKLLEDLFQAPVYQWYGQVETTVNIHECEKRRLHIKEEYGYLELLNEEGEDAAPGEVASVIGTGWGNKAFPLVRYDTGDNMILSDEQKCSCGRNGRIIKQIVGRDEDVIITPEGRIVGRLDFIFKPVDSVKESQIIQEALDKLIVKVVPLNNFGKKDRGLIMHKLREYLGSSVQIKIEEVDAIERTPAGKIKYVVSKVNQS